MPLYAEGLQPTQTMTPDYRSHVAFNSLPMLDTSFGQYPGVGPDGSHLDFDPYKNIPPPSATLFPPTDFGNPAHLMRRDRPVQERRARAPQSKEQEVVGGVSAKLDYDIEMMTDFVCEMATVIIQPGTKAPPNFRKWVLHVLNATRLPSATILMSLYYLSLRVRSLSAQGLHHPNERSIYQMLIVGLILGSKFLDDNTFQNKSWAEVSSIKVVELNREEREWLGAFDHRLHIHPSVPEGFNHWADAWEGYQVRAVTQQSTVLHPLDTNLHRQHSMHQAVRQTPSPVNYNLRSAPPYLEPESFTTPYPPYDPWLTRSAVERSPPSAPHTGPTTPDYYGGSSIWTPGPFGYQMPSAYQTPYAMPYQPRYGWDVHGPGCGCNYCARPAPQYVFPARYGPTVAG